jgi:peptidyl-prolyl cis-trans isomerase D
MLNQLRNLTKTWVAAFFVALLVASFAIWGVGDIFTARTPDAVAVVGKEKITIVELARDFDRELDRAQLDRQTAIQIGIPQQVLSNLIARAAAEQHQRALGLVTTEDAIARDLRGTEAFIDPITGRFDRDTYLMMLRNAGLAPAEYERSRRLDLAQAQLGSALGSGLLAPDALAEAHARFMGETRALSVVTIPPGAAGDVAEPTPEELEAFYAEHGEAFALPPRRAISFVTLTPADFMTDVPIDEELLRQMYEERRERLRTPERRDIVELSAPDAEAAAEAARRLREGEDPAAVAAALELAPPAVHDDALPTDLLTSALADAAFAVGEGEVTEPIDAGIAWFVARVDAVTPGVEQTFEEARPALAEEVARQAADERLFEVYDAFERARLQGASLEAAAAAAGVPVFSYGPVDSTGAFADGVSAQQLAAMPEILTAAFAAPAVGTLNELGEVGEGYFALRVDEIIPATTRPLAEVEAEVRAQYAITKAAEAMNALAETARARLAEGAAPSDAAAAVGSSARGEISELRRDQATAALSRELLVPVFTAATGDVLVGASGDGGRVVARVDAIKAGAADLAPEEIESARALITASINQDLTQIFQQGLQSAYRVQTYKAPFDQAIGATNSASQ